MSEKEKNEEFYKNIFPRDVLTEIGNDYSKVAEEQEQSIKNQKEMIRSLYLDLVHQINLFPL